MVSKTQLALIIGLLAPMAAVAQTGTVTIEPNTAHVIPGIVAVSASPTHLLVLSESEGLIVYRTRPDTLQWLYTSEGMVSRGRRLSSDSRFSYLMGDDSRLSILEPTALQGVWSSVTLPARPRLAVRSGTTLFTLTEQNGLYAVPLTRPADVERFDTLTVENIRPDAITDMVLFNRQILAANGRNLVFFDPVGSRLTNPTVQRLNQDILRLHDINGVLHASNARGELFEVRGGGTLRKVLEVPEGIRTVIQSGRHFHIRGESGRSWILATDGRIIHRRPNPESGNHIARVNDRVWMSEFSNFGRITVSETGGNPSAGAGLRLKPIPTQTLLLPRPLLLNIELAAPVTGIVRYTVRSETASPVIRGNGLFWQPGNADLGSHEITIHALSESGARDSVRFMVDVRNFNQPPRFTPMRPITIIANEPYSTTFRAIDPDSPSPDLIRYTASDLPGGSTLSERTGLFNWTPDMRQVGVHRFTLRATDAHGVSAETSIQITVRGPAPTGE
jgi:hypothetical protein